MSAVLKQTHYTVEEYLNRESSVDYKSEFHNGQIYAMSGASREHNLIVFNISGELSIQLKKRPCEAYIGDMRVKEAQAENYYYPDITVVCEEPQFEKKANVDTLLNPILLIEVLSPSTEAFDRGVKFSHYRRIASLREYILVSQDRAMIERYLRQGDVWILSEYAGLNAIMPLESIECELSLQEVYDKVSFKSEMEIRQQEFGG